MDAKNAMNTVSEQQGGGEERKLLSGVFSLQEVRKVGTGTTTRKTIQKSFWFAEEQAGGEVELQLLNSNYVPSGPRKQVPMDTFLATYAPEPEFFVSNVFPRMRELNKTVARADRYRANNELYSAEMEYNNALRLDIENVKANFGLGITYMERGETAKAENILERLIKLDAAFEKKHKHLFNDFGISLRKSGMLNQSVEYYKRALELSRQDENLYYNLARVYLEQKKTNECIENLLIALQMNPLHEVSTKFLMWLVQKKLVPQSDQEKVVAALKAIKQAQQGGARPRPQNADQVVRATQGDGEIASNVPGGTSEAPLQPHSPAGESFEGSQE